MCMYYAKTKLTGREQIKAYQPNQYLTSFFPNSVKKWSSKERLASRTWQYTIDLGMECRKLAQTILTYAKTVVPVYSTKGNY